jgi:hypothetical protein
VDVTSLVDQWVCASFFQPSATLDTWKWGGHQIVANPASVACNGIDSVPVYCYVALSVAAVMFILLVIAFTMAEQDGDAVFGGSAGIALAAGVLWPITTFAAPAVLVGFVARHAAQRFVVRSKIRKALEAKQLAELQPYLEQIDKDLAR